MNICDSFLTSNDTVRWKVVSVGLSWRHCWSLVTLASNVIKRIPWWHSLTQGICSVLCCSEEAVLTYDSNTTIHHVTLGHTVQLHNVSFNWAIGTMNLCRCWMYGTFYCQCISAWQPNEEMNLFHRINALKSNLEWVRNGVNLLGQSKVMVLIFL